MKRRTPSILAALSLMSGCLAAGAPDVSPAQPRIPPRQFRISDFGAAGDGKTPDTGAFRKAIEAVDRAGGGTLVVAAGTYLTGPIDLCSGLNLRLESGARILFSDRASDYPRLGKARRPQIVVDGRHDVMISGRGTIDGQGGSWWPAARAARDPVTGRQLNGTTTPRPPMLVFRDCRRIRVEGVTLANSPALNLGIQTTEDSTVDGITILNPADSPNTDGIDPKATRRLLITRCRIDTGDDCIAIGGGGNDGATADTLVTDCAFLHGHGCSIGSHTTGAVRNLTVLRCSFDGTETGIRLKSARDRGGPVENLVYSDLTMRNVGHAISLNSHYEGTTTDAAVVDHEAPEPVTRTTPSWRNILIRNLTAENGTVDAGLIVGLPEMPAEDIVLENVRIQAPRGLQLGYARKVVLRDVRIDAKQGPPLIVSETVRELTQ